MYKLIKLDGIKVVSDRKDRILKKEGTTTDEFLKNAILYCLLLGRDITIVFDNGETHKLLVSNILDYPFITKNSKAVFPEPESSHEAIIQERLRMLKKYRPYMRQLIYDD